MMATLSSSIENIGRMFMQSQSAVHQTSYPMSTPGSSWSFTEPGPGPSQYPRTVTPTSSVRQPLTFRSPAPSGLKVHTVTTPTPRTTDSVRLPVRSVPQGSNNSMAPPASTPTTLRVTQDVLNAMNQNPQRRIVVRTPNGDQVLTVMSNPTP